MLTIISVSTSEYRIKGSRFLGYLPPSQDRSDRAAFIEKIKSDHHTASHHCYATIYNPNEPIEFYSDDGEPGGTAGLPILNVLKSNNLMNAILIVVRYYGGTKLGKSGLIDAYQTTAQKAVHSASLKKLMPINMFTIHFEYHQQNLINKWKRTFKLIEFESEYLENVRITVGCPINHLTSFEVALNANEHNLISFESKGKSFHIVK